MRGDAVGFPACPRARGLPAVRRALDEPVLQTANPVVVHPNALGEAAMAAQTTAVLALG